jgi:hypothetical protein
MQTRLSHAECSLSRLARRRRIRIVIESAAF